MFTLSNVQNVEVQAEPRHAGLASVIIPEAKCSETGVSVNYVFAPDKEWYVLRASYGRELKAANYLLSNGIYTYLPMHDVYKRVGGKIKRLREVLVPNLIFTYATKDDVDHFIRFSSAISYCSLYYNHFSIEDGKNPPLRVPHKDMLNFINVTNKNNEHVRLVEPSQCHFKTGDVVRITDGTFTGVEGRVARVAGQQRVVVEVKGVCMIATAYIPTAFLEKVEN